MWVFLADTHEEDWLTGTLNHVDCCADFLIDCVKLSQDNTINTSRIRLYHSKINQALIELSQLINSIITNKGFTDKQDYVGLVDVDELRQLAHKLFVALHAACCVDQDDIVAFITGFLDCFLCDCCRIILVAFFVNVHI